MQKRTQTGIGEEVLKIAETIPDPYVRTLTLARLGYLLSKSEPKASVKAFKLAVSSLDYIDDPVLILRAMVSTSRYLRMAGVEELSESMLHRAYEGALLLRGRVKDSLLVDIIRESMRAGKKRDAILYATDIEDESLRNRLLLEIVRSLVQEGDVQMARKVLNVFSSEPERSQAIVEVIRGHLAREEFASVLSLLPTIENEYWLEMALEETAKSLRDSGVPKATYEKFVEAAKELSERLGKDLLSAFLTGLVEGGDVLGAAEILNSVTGNRGGIASYLSKLLIDRPRELEAFLSSIRLSPEEFDGVAKATLDALLERKPSPEYRNIVEFLGRKAENERVLVKVATYLAKIGDFETAEEFGRAIDDPYLRSLAFGAIALEKLRRGDIDGAIDAVKNVPDIEWGSWLMGEILVKILEGSLGEHPERELERKAELHRRSRGGS